MNKYEFQNLVIEITGAYFFNFSAPFNTVNSITKTNPVI